MQLGCKSSSIVLWRVEVDEKLRYAGQVREVRKRNLGGWHNVEEAIHFQPPCGKLNFHGTVQYQDEANKIWDAIM